MTKCPKCGSYIPDGGKMCIACGWKPESEEGAFTDMFKDNPYVNYLQQVMDTVVDKFPGKDDREKADSLPHDDSRWIAAASYLGPAFLYTYFAKSKDSELIKYHANQASILFALRMCFNLIGKTNAFGGIIKKMGKFGLSVLAFLGAKAAVANKLTPVPVIGDMINVTILK